MMDSSQLMTFTVSLLAILNPIGNAAIFLGLAGSKSRAEQTRIVITCSITVGVVLLFSIWLGGAMLVLGGLYYFFVHRHLQKK